MPYGTQYIPGGKPYDDMYAQVQDGFPDNKNVKFETAEMKPGTVLFLPRGTWHYTEAGEPSLSLSITISPPTLLDCAMEQIRWLLLQDSAWREPLYGATANGALHENLRAHTRRLLDRLPQLVSSLSPEDLIQAPIPVAKRLDQISEKTRFQRIPDAAARSGDQQVTARACRWSASGWAIPNRAPESPRAWRSPPEVLAVFRWIEGQHKPFTGADVQTAFPEACLSRS